MDLDTIRDYCLGLDNVTEGFPFGDGALVFKVGKKMFALVMLDAVPLQMNLKCEPEKALELRELYECVTPGFHMNKKHWNTIVLEPRLGWDLVREWIDDSYRLVCGKDKRRTLHNGE